MSNIYLIPGLERAQRKALKSAGVEWSEWDGDTVSVDHEMLAEALRVLGATATESHTEFEGVINLELRFVPRGAVTAEVRGLTRAQAESRKNYIAACSSRIQSEMDEANAALKESWQELPSLQEGFVYAKRSGLFSNGSLSDDELRERFSQELARLLELPKVTAVHVVPGSILVYTNKLCATNPDTGDEHELGKFLIVINTDGRDYGVRWFNGSRRIDGARLEMNAPNVYDDGTACADDLLPTFFELIARCEFASLADLAIQFVEEVTDDEYAKYVRKWPRAKS